MKFEIERINGDSYCYLLDEKSKDTINFGNLQHVLRDYYYLDNCNYYTENIFKPLNRIIGLLENYNQDLLYQYYKTIISTIDSKHNVDKITESLQNIIELLLKIPDEKFLTKENITNLSLLYHATDTKLKEVVTKEEYFEIIKLGIITKCVLPITNYYHLKWVSMDTLSIYLALNSTLRSFPKLLKSLNIIRNIVKSNCSINEFEHYCLLIEENIYLHDLPYYDLTYLTENNNILNIINKDVIDKIKIVSNLFLEYDIEKL